MLIQTLVSNILLYYISDLNISEVVSILSSDEEDVGSADSSMPNVNPSPTSSRSNTPVQNPGAKPRKQRMEDKVILVRKFRVRMICGGF